MNNMNNKIKLSELNNLDLIKMCFDLKKQLLSLRLRRNTEASSNDTSVFSKIKANVARIKTEITKRNRIK